jgi:hypothetical protein
MCEWLVNRAVEGQRSVYAAAGIGASSLADVYQAAS